MDYEKNDKGFWVRQGANSAVVAVAPTPVPAHTCSFDVKAFSTSRAFRLIAIRALVQMFATSGAIYFIDRFALSHAFQLLRGLVYNPNNQTTYINFNQTDYQELDWEIEVDANGIIDFNVILQSGPFPQAIAVGDTFNSNVSLFLSPL